MLESIREFLNTNRPPDTAEWKQMHVRAAVVSTIVGFYIVMSLLDRTITDDEAFTYLVGFGAMGIMLAHLAWMLLAPGYNPKRRVAGALLDNANISTVMILGDGGFTLFGLYLWVTIGNGFRFGRSNLYASQIFSIIGFAAVSVVMDMWQHVINTIALFAMLVAVPSYVAGLLKQKEADQRELEIANATAERASKAKSHFIAAASHDLRQPMQALSLYAGALIGSPEGARLSSRLIHGIQLSVQSLEQMFDSILDISRIETGAITPHHVSFPIQPLLERIIQLEKPLAEMKGLQMHFHPTTMCVRSDPALLERIIKNLVTNAIRYTNSGRIVIGCRRAGDAVKVVVIDSGIGIPADEQAAVFGDFYQGRTSTAQGLGLGLPIVKNLTELLGHKLTFTSTEGRGSTFEVEMPRSFELIAPAAPLRRNSDARNLNGACVILIDDDVEIRESMSLMLEQWGCLPIVGPSLKSVLQVLDARNLQPHAIVADYRLTDSITGIETINLLRARYQRDVPALLISGTTNIALLQPKANNFPVLSKPVQPGKLRAFIAQALSETKLEATAASISAQPAAAATGSASRKTNA